MTREDFEKMSLNELRAWGEERNPESINSIYAWVKGEMKSWSLSGLANLYPRMCNLLKQSVIPYCPTCGTAIIPVGVVIKNAEAEIKAAIDKEREECTRLIGNSGHTGLAQMIRDRGES